MPSRAAEETPEKLHDRNAADVSHEYLSVSVESLAQQLDSFFGGDRAFDAGTGSYLRVRGWLFDRVDADPETKADVRLRLILPLTQDKLGFELMSDPHSETPEEERGQTELAAPIGKDQDDFLAGLKAVFLDTDPWKASVSTGLRFGSPVDYFVRGTLRRKDDLAEWRLRLEQTAFWFGSERFGARSSAILDRSLMEPLIFRSSSLALWTEDDLSWRLSESLALLQSIDSWSALAYRVGASWGSRPVVRPEEYSCDVTYRRRIYSSWLFFDVRPGLSWPRSRDFRPTPGIFLRLEMVFGEESLAKAE